VLCVNYNFVQAGFCPEICVEELACGHKCSIKCHLGKDHNTKCGETVSSPCPLHPQKLICHKIYPILNQTRIASTSSLAFALSKKTFQPASLKSLLSSYKCPLLVDLLLPCSHVRKLACSDKSKIDCGDVSWPSCDEPAIAPFTYPTCKHQISNIECWQNEEYELGKQSPPPCSKKIQFKPRTCSHSIEISCSQEKDYAERHRCTIFVSLPLPRCCHQTKMPCFEAIKLKAWQG
jgi:hypothetical protein